MMMIEEQDNIDAMVLEDERSITRRNEWKHAVRRRRILKEKNREMKKPLHYYSKNPPWDGYAEEPNKTNNKGKRRYISKNYRPVKNWSPHDSNQIDEFNDQLIDLE